MVATAQDSKELCHRADFRVGAYVKPMRPRYPEVVFRPPSTIFIFLRSVREAPEDTAPGTPMGFALETGFGYQVDKTSGPWMRIRPLGEGGSGWVNAGVGPTAWPLQQALPELNFLDGVVGFLRWRGQEESRERHMAQKELLAQTLTLAPWLDPGGAGG